MPLGDYVLGLAYFAGTWGLVAAATALVAARRLAHLAGAARVLAVGVVFTALLIAVHAVPGALAVLARETVLLAAGAAFLLARTVPSAAGASSSAQEADATEPSPWWSWILAVTALLAVGLTIARFVAAHVTDPIRHVDTLVAHLPGAARWIQEGSLWGTHDFAPLLAHGTYPDHGIVLFLSMLLPWRNDAFVRLVDVPYLALAALAAYAIARELRVPRAPAALFATLVLAVPVITRYAVDQVNVDAPLLAMLGAGLLFAARHVRTDRHSDLVLAAIATGIAVGTKWNGVTAGAALLGAWALALLLGGRRARGTLRRIAVASGIVALAGGFWLLRNLVATGNPLYPVKVEALGLTVFDAPPDLLATRYGGSIADYLGNGTVLRETVLPELRQALGPAGLLLAAALPVAIVAVVAMARRAGRITIGHAQLLLVVVAAVLVVAVYVVTPTSAYGPAGAPVPGFVGFNSRYAMPALVFAAPLAAWLAAQAGRLRPIVEVGAVAAALAGIRRTLPWDAEAAVAFGLALLGAALATGALWVLWRAQRSRFARLTYAAAAFCAIAAAGQLAQERFNDGRYRGLDASVDWVLSNAPAGRRIAMAGSWGTGPLPSPVYPLFGPRLRNEVAYAGRMIGHTLAPERDPDAFAARLRRDGYDLLLVGRGLPPRRNVPEIAWARAAGFEPVARSDRFTLLQRRAIG